MGRGHSPNITEKVKHTILSIAAANPNYSAEQIRRHIIRHLSAYKLKENQVPQRRSIQKIVAKNSDILKKLENDPKNKPWNMGTLIDYDIPSPALALILEIQDERRKKHEEHLTIREAWWIAHLCDIVKTTKVHPKTQVIDFWAKKYSGEQLFSEIIGKPLDTSIFDKIIITYAEEYAMFNLYWPHVEEEKGFEATAGLFSSLLEQKSILHIFDESGKNINNLTSRRDLVEQKKLLRKAEKALQESEKIWNIIVDITDKARVESLSKVKATLRKIPAFKIHMQNKYQLDEQEVEKQIEELKKRISEREAHNELPHDQSVQG